MLKHLGVNIDPRQRGIDGSCTQIEQAGRAGANQNDLSVDVVLRNLPGQHLPGRDILGLIVVAEFKKDASGSIGGDDDVADADVVKPGGLPKSRLATGV